MSDEQNTSASSSPEPIKVTFDWDGSGSAALARHILDSEPELAKLERRVRRFRLLSVIVCAAPIIVTAHVLVTRATPWADGFGWLLGVFLVPLCLMFALSRVGAWSIFRAKLQDRAARSPRPETVRLTITADAQGISTADEHRIVTHRWNNIDQVVRIPDFIAVIFSNSGSGMTIPLSAFENSDAADAFETALHRLLVSAGFERKDRVRTILAHESVLCGTCGHDLRGLLEPQCPECGRQLTILSLTMFRALQLSWWRLAALREDKPRVADD